LVNLRGTDDNESPRNAWEANKEKNVDKMDLAQYMTMVNCLVP